MREKQWQRRQTICLKLWVTTATWNKYPFSQVTYLNFQETQLLEFLRTNLLRNLCILWDRSLVTSLLALSLALKPILKLLVMVWDCRVWFCLINSSYMAAYCKILIEFESHASSSPTPLSWTYHIYGKFNVLSICNSLESAVIANTFLMGWRSSQLALKSPFSKQS